MKYPYENLKDLTLPSVFDRSVELFGQRDALTKINETPMTYNDFHEKVMQMIEVMQERGISKGDKVVLLSENMPHWAVAYFSVTYMGAIIVPILPDFHPSDVYHIVRHSEAKAIFTSDKYLPTIEENNDHNINFVINLERLEVIEELNNHNYFSELTKMVTKKITKNSEEVRPAEDDLAAIIYTSGTTGHSKGVMLSHKNLVANALSACAVIQTLETDVFLSVLPLAHTYECTVGLILPIVHGSSIYYINKTPTPSVLMKAFSTVKPTYMLSVPLIIEKIYKNKVLKKINESAVTRNLYKIPFFRKKLNKIAGKKLYETFGGRLRFFGIGGAALSPFVENFLIEAEFPFTVGYGLTETAPLLAGTAITAKTKFKSTGPAMLGVELKIKDPDANGEGEIIAKSPSVMIGYYKDKEKTAEVMEDGWFLTGDLGYIDEDGYLFISGRSKNVIIGSGGENIYPEQIESVINQNEAVLSSLVMEQDNKIVARIYLDYELIDNMFNANKVSDAKAREDITNYLEEMRKDVNSQISSFSRISSFIEQTEPFVETPTKKIKRFLYKK